jgi:hypothetical protein
MYQHCSQRAALYQDLEYLGSAEQRKRHEQQPRRAFSERIEVEESIAAFA